jgi:DNA-directed RNA polymerase subunit F
MIKNTRAHLLAIVLLIGLFSCKSKTASIETKEKTTNNQPKIVKVEEPTSVNIEEVKNTETEKNKEAEEELYSLIVSFYSIGAGIDAPVARDFDFYVRDFQEQHGDYFLAERVPWGREGEVDYCIQFPTLNKEKAREFVNKTREITSASKMVHVKENAPCKRRRKTN